MALRNGFPLGASGFLSRKPIGSAEMGSHWAPMGSYWVAIGFQWVSMGSYFLLGSYWVPIVTADWGLRRHNLAFSALIAVLGW